MIRTINEFISRIKDDLANWKVGTKPWFRGESTNDPPLCPKIAQHGANIENYLLQSFRRKAGGLADVPPRNNTDMWLFLAQHYGVPTRLLDWTEGALFALYFAINQKKQNPRVYMLNPRRLNELAGSRTIYPNYPLSWSGGGGDYVRLAWENRVVEDTRFELVIPFAFPAIYQDNRMISQRSCFTIHGRDLRPMQQILSDNNVPEAECLYEYEIDFQNIDLFLCDLSILGISAGSVFPDLDHLAKDLCLDIENL
jgi:hypothetical protein